MTPRERGTLSREMSTTDTTIDAKLDTLGRPVRDLRI